MTDTPPPWAVVRLAGVDADGRRRSDRRREVAEGVPAYPVGSTIVIILVVYAIVVHGGQLKDVGY